MKKLVVLCLGILLTFAAAAQARTADVEYLKINRQAIVTEMPFAEKTVRKTIEDKMTKLGYKGKDTKTYTMYSGVKLAELGPDAYDLYFMVDRKSRKEKEIAVVTMLVSKGLDAFVTESTDATVMSNAKTFVNNLVPNVVAYDLELQIVDQEDVVKKNEKKGVNLVDDAAGLQKDKIKLEKKIDDNIKDQATQKTEIEKQKLILETLRGKRKL
jgi:hypothetical protein